ncbi:MAG: hypothetical protein H0W50_00370 [Parachlamydiaceae bacterium]|nr:hypothetical protein [Parachlamydiaceae bacterium]
MEPLQTSSTSSKYVNPLYHYFNNPHDACEDILIINGPDSTPTSTIPGSIFGYLWSIPFSGYHLVNKSLQTAYDYFYDGNHIWKQEIYRNILEQTILGLKKSPKLITTFYPDLADMCFNRLNEYLNCLDATDLDLSVSKLLQYFCEYSPDHRQKYNIFLSMLRSAVETEAYAEQLAICENWHKIGDKLPCLGFCVLLDLSYVRFNEVNIYPFCDYLVNKVINTGLQAMRNLSFSQKSILDTYSENMGLSSNDFDAISHMDKELRASRAEVDWGKFKGTVNKNFDPHTQNNPPFILGSLQITKTDGSFKNLILQRIGTPTREGLGLTSYAEVTPEFRAYLDGCKIHRERHLYISLQSDQSKWIGYEAHRNTALKLLQDEYSATETFNFVILDQDSSFYHQIGYEFGKEELETDTFIEQLKYQMLTPQGNFYFPPRWLEEITFHDHCERVMNITLIVMFGAKPEILYLNQRKDFFEIFFVILILHITNYIQADKLNISCKDAIDRSGKAVSLLIKMLHVAQGHANHAEHQCIHRVYTHAPALLVKKQAIIEKRRKRLESALQWLDDPEVQKRIADQDISLLPINYHGEFAVEKPKGQRPKENAFIDCKIALYDLSSKMVKLHLIDQKCIEDLITARINQDLFIDDNAHVTLRSIFLENNFDDLLDLLAEKVAKSTLIQEQKQQIKDYVTDLLFVSLIHSGCLNNTQHQLSAPKEFKKLLKLLIGNPEQILKRQTNTL